MNREYHKWYSPTLRRDMPCLVYGHAGTPMLVFPTSRGSFHEYEDRGMIGALASFINQGWFQVFCPTSVDEESWYNYGAHPGYRVHRHIEYENYVIHEFLPFIRSKNRTDYLIVTGCSFGGYHSINFAFRHSDVVNKVISLGGAYDIHQFVTGYYDDNCYFNNPMDYMPNLTDEWYMSQLRQMKIILGTGEWDMCLDSNIKLSNILNGKSIPHWLDVWGDHTGHDWPWWRQMIVKYLGMY
jgi:esterase/lipase superfamily enzyme